MPDRRRLRFWPGVQLMQTHPRHRLISNPPPSRPALLRPTPTYTHRLAVAVSCQRPAALFLLSGWGQTIKRCSWSVSASSGRMCMTQFWTRFSLAYSWLPHRRGISLFFHWIIVLKKLTAWHINELWIIKFPQWGQQVKRIWENDCTAVACVGTFLKMNLS